MQKLLDESKDLAEGETRFRKGDDVETSTGEELTPREREQQKRDVNHRTTIEKESKNLNTDIAIHDSVDDIDTSTQAGREAKAAIERGEKVKAWYDMKTGEVHLYLPNVTDKYDAQKSVAHEVVGHKGIFSPFPCLFRNSFLNLLSVFKNGTQQNLI